MKLIRSTKSKTTKSKNGENVRRLEITEVVLVHCNIVNSNYQKDSRVLYTFAPNKLFGQLLGILPKKIYILTQNFDILNYGLLIKILDQ